MGVAGGGGRRYCGESVGGVGVYFRRRWWGGRRCRHGSGKRVMEAEGRGGKFATNCGKSSGGAVVKAGVFLWEESSFKRRLSSAVAI